VRESSLILALLCVLLSSLVPQCLLFPVCDRRFRFSLGEIEARQPKMISMDSRGAALKANAAVFLVLASLALLTRIWVRIKITKRFWMDDWILLVAVVCFLESKRLVYDVTNKRKRHSSTPLLACILSPCTGDWTKTSKILTYSLERMLCRRGTMQISSIYSVQSL
jgi:hypothetical protein